MRVNDFPIMWLLLVEPGRRVVREEAGGAGDVVPAEMRQLSNRGLAEASVGLLGGDLARLRAQVELVGDAVLHDHRQIVLVLQDPDVLYRVAAHQEEVG
jgi:hypothetical protein